MREIKDYKNKTYETEKNKSFLSLFIGGMIGGLFGLPLSICISLVSHAIYMGETPFTLETLVTILCYSIYVFLFPATYIVVSIIGFIISIVMWSFHLLVNRDIFVVQRILIGIIPMTLMVLFICESVSEFPNGTMYTISFIIGVGSASGIMTGNPHRTE
jgi:hypothetical protein